jgi:ABC-2 type transport system ATP-binding protein
MGAGRNAVVADGLGKRFGDKVALDGFDLTVAEGAVCGLLGPNGAGKTTAVRVLATLLRADTGRAEVAGFDVAREAAMVRRQIGLTGQQATVDDILTGRENLIMWGRLFHLGSRAAARRADELLEQFGLTDAAHRRAKLYSGGMRRRLDIASSLVLAPRVFFLDEPTTGLDPRNRGEVWNALRGLVAGGTTVLMTTQYLDEADQLADQIVVLDGGRTVAEGTPSQLKSATGSTSCSVTRRTCRPPPPSSPVSPAPNRMSTPRCAGSARRCGAASPRSRRWSGRSTTTASRPRTSACAVRPSTRSSCG